MFLWLAKNGHLLRKPTLFAVRGTYENCASTAISIREGVGWEGGNYNEGSYCGTSSIIINSCSDKTGDDSSEEQKKTTRMAPS